MVEPDSTSIDWEFLIGQITKGRCVLFLGPDLLTEPEGASFQQRLKTYLESQNGQQMPYYSQDEFFSFKKKAQKRRTYNVIQGYFEAQKPQSVHTLIAEIPFHLIISLSPDQLLPEAFGRAQFPYGFAYYKMGKNPAPLPLSYTDQPLIYNLLGTATDDHSLVFSYEDLFSYLEGIFGAYKLPDTLRQSLQQAEHLIFLGIQYDKWYMKLLLRLLGLHEEKDIAACGDEGFWEGELKAFYEEHFDEINFFETGAMGFVEALYAECQARGVLRKIGGVSWQGNLLQQVQQAIAANKTQEALNQLREYARRYRPEWLSEIALLTGQFNALQEDKRTGVIDYASAEQRFAKLHKALLELAQKLERGEEL